MIDADKSIEESVRGNERRLGRKLTDQEENAIAGEVNSAANTELGVGFAWFIVIAAGAAWALDKAGIVAGGIYSSYVEPYWLWMIQSHTDSFFNLLLQVYLWPILVPLAISIVIVFLPALITFYLIGLGFSWLGCRVDGSLGGLLSGFASLLCLIMLVVCPISIFFYSVNTTAGIALVFYRFLHNFIKNKIFRLKHLSLFWWLFLTHLVIPAILILFVMLFAAEESHIKNGKNVYRNACEWRAN